MQAEKLLTYKRGLKDGFPICLGYVSVAFTFGITASLGGLPVWASVLTSLTNVTSAGQFAGIGIMMAGGSFIEMAMTTLIINLRYALMSFSLSQKLDNKFSLVDKLLISFVNTDEVFAVASSMPCNVNKKYMYGLITSPFLGWTIGTLLGAVAGSLLPKIILSALGIAIYGMFIAIVVPACKSKGSVLLVVVISILLSCAFRFLPLLSSISSGFVIIIVSVLASLFGAIFFPIKEEVKNAN